MWAYRSVFYQIYPLGFVGAPFVNDHQVINRLQKVQDWIPHFQELNINAIIFNPVFQSKTHGYDGMDYLKIDERLGSNRDFQMLVKALHQAQLKVIVDGVFNHVGRGFWAFQDVLKNRQLSKYCSWFQLDFQKNTLYNDGFFYEAWENHFELVKLNLNNPEVVDYLLGCVKSWIIDFDIDGLRLDVAYSLPVVFMQKLRSFCTSLKPDFFLFGEIIHGDYSLLMNSQTLHSVTNYQAYKGLWSSFNSLNFFEIAHTFKEHYLEKYPNTHEINFLDNHDVNRIASQVSGVLRG